MAKNSSWPVTGLGSREPLKDLKDSKLILNESKLFPWSSMISLVPFRIFRGPLFPKPVTGQELFFAISYSKPALGCGNCWQKYGIYLRNQSDSYYYQLMCKFMGLKRHLASSNPIKNRTSTFKPILDRFVVCLEPYEQTL